MSVTPSRSDHLTFVAGLNTEGGYFTQPPNTWRDGDNMIPNIDGSLSRRLCLDFETNYTPAPSTIASPFASSNAYTTYYWRNVGGVGGLTWYVVQVGRYVWFYTNEGLSVSLNKTTHQVDLNLYRVAAATTVLGSQPIHCASIEGSLLIVAKDIEPIFLEYDGTTINVTQLTLKFRDFEGVDDGLAVEERPTTLSDEHKYNLMNQGWSVTNMNAYKAAKGVYPSNAQMWLNGKDSSGNFDSNVLDQVDFGTSHAPMGRYLLNAFTQDRATASGITGLPTYTEVNRPTTCAFFAGRAWFSGIGGTKLGSWVMFSHLGYKPTDYGECFQIADPTSEVLSDLVETDGGVIPVKDAENIHALLPMYDGIIVFAENGVWQIVGSSQGGFSATGYGVYKLSNLGSIAPEAIVQVENTAYYWSTGGIYQLGQDPTTGNIVSKPVTDLSIKSLYVAIPSVAKSFAKGSFNNSTKRITWTYNDALTNSSSFPYSKAQGLVLDLRLGAFYTWSTTYNAASYPVVVSQLVTDISAPTSSVSYVVTDTLDPVVDNLGNLVTVTASDLTTYDETEKYLTIYTTDAGTTYSVTFSDMNTTLNAPSKFYDWYTRHGFSVPFSSYLVTGFDVSQSGPSNKKYPTYCTTYMKRTETAFDANGNALNESSCLMQARWDFTDNVVAGKWSAEQEVYRHRQPFLPTPSTDYVDGFPLVISKNKIRGSGKALQFKFSSSPNKDMQLVGWQVILINNQNV